MMSSARLFLLVLGLAALGSAFPGRKSTGTSNARITFVDTRRPGGPAGGSIQFGQTSATSNQMTSGDRQVSTGQASGVSVQKQTGLGGATQVTNNQALINSAQEATGGGTGSGGQTSSNQVNIQSTQLQQNVNGTLVNVESGHQGVLIVNTNDGRGNVVDQQLVNNRPIAPETEESAMCRYTCRRSTGQLYCCDDGSNTGGSPAIHGGQCPEARLICPQGGFFKKCAHDGQCTQSDKCCYDACANHHICKRPDV